MNRLLYLYNNDDEGNANHATSTLTTWLQNVGLRIDATNENIHSIRVNRVRVRNASVSKFTCRKECANVKEKKSDQSSGRNNNNNPV